MIRHPALRDEAAPSAWRFFPLAVVLSLLCVIAVNGALVWWAVETNPGEPGESGFDLSNQYDRILDGVQQQAALGWKVSAKASGRHVTLAARDAKGLSLPRASVSVIAERPLGAKERTDLEMRAAGADYAAAVDLPAAGQWDLLINVVDGKNEYHATQRVVVP